LPLNSKGAMEMSEEKDVVENEQDVTEPIIINLGKQKKKRIKKMMNGQGRLWYEVQDVIDEVGVILGDELDGKVIVPLILVYEKKSKKKSRGFFG
jgi:hypothetical protein